MGYGMGGMMGNMFGNGYNYGGSSGWLWSLGSSLINIIIIIGIMVFVYKLIKNNRIQEADITPPAIKILKEKYALGEINEEEYKRKLKFLK